MDTKQTFSVLKREDYADVGVIIGGVRNCKVLTQGITQPLTQRLTQCLTHVMICDLGNCDMLLTQRLTQRLTQGATQCLTQCIVKSDIKSDIALREKSKNCIAKRQADRQTK